MNGNSSAPCLDSILASDYPPELLEIIVADGMSDDGTRDVLQQYCQHHASIHFVDNPGRIVPTGLNQAIRMATGKIIVRMDAHTEYAADYIKQCVMVLAETNADNVGGAWRTKADGYLQEAIALAWHSPFRRAGARSRDLDYEGPVDTVIYGCWRKDRLLELGLFDEEFVRNQDDELSLRITRSGGVIWQSARIKSWYSPSPFADGTVAAIFAIRILESTCHPKAQNPCLVAALDPRRLAGQPVSAAGAFAVQQSGCLASGDSRRVLSVGQSGSNRIDRPAPSARQIPSYSAVHLRLLSPGVRIRFLARVY